MFSPTMSVLILLKFLGFRLKKISGLLVNIPSTLACAGTACFGRENWKC